MRDLAIRTILYETELAKFVQDSHSKVVEELNLPVASARIDIAVINGLMHGYEIKSASDTLIRLPRQIAGYSKVFDLVTVVTEDRHASKVINSVPEWVGVSICSDKKAMNSYQVIKSCKPNKFKEAFYIAKLLRNEELLQICTEYRLPIGKRPRNWSLCELLASNFVVDDLSEVVRIHLKMRVNWKTKQDLKVM